MNIKKSNSLTYMLLVFVLLISLLLSTAPFLSAANAENTGAESTSEWDGYTAISTKEELYAIRNNLSGKFYLTNDITFDSGDFLIKGEYYNNGELWGNTDSFTGILDGNGYIISGLNLSNSVGLFSTNNGTIRNLGLAECTINSTNRSGCGSFAGTNNGTIINCYSTGTMVNDNNSFAYTGLVGGIVGYNTDSGTIENCNSSIDITACEFIDAAGGIAGCNAGTIRYSQYSGTLVSACYKNGGIAGINTGLVESSYNTGSITGDDAGGIVGRCQSGGEINDCYNAGTVSGGSAGGIVEYCTGESAVQNCYNAGTVSGDDAGGIASSCEESLISNCYNVGLVASNYGDSAGAIVCGIDQEYFPCTILNCYYKISGNISAYSNAEDDAGVFACSEAQMHQASTYTEFDFTDTWLIEENNFPVLRSCQQQKLELNIKKLPTKLLYLIGESFDDKGMVVQEFLKYAEWDTLEPGEYSISEFDSTTAGTKTITVADGELTDKFSIRVVIAIIAGNVTISGTPEYGQELTVDLSVVSPSDAALNYEWKRGTAIIGTSDTYTVAADDIGQQITVTISGAEDYAGELTSPSVTPVKASRETPAAPQTSAVTADSITVSAVTGQEYRLGTDGEWQSDTVFANLTPLTEYKIYTRIPETDTHFASEISEPLIVTTLGIPATAIEIDDIGLYELETGEQFELEVIVTPANTTDTLTYTWKSSDESIVSVDNDGKITAVAPGSAVITVTASNGLTDDCDVTVASTGVPSIDHQIYAVTFESNGGSSIASQSLEAGETAIRPDDPTREGYTFENWYSDIALTSVYDFTTPVLQNMTLYAKWNINTYIVSFISNGGTSISPQYVTYGDTASMPMTPIKNGYTFLGWYSDAALTIPYSFSSGISADMILYAKWQINTYTVSFYTNGGSAVPSQTVNYASTATAPDNPVKSGYIFDGWYSDSSLRNPYNFNSPVLSDTSVYAGWQTIDDKKGDSIPGTGDAENHSSLVFGLMLCSLFTAILTGYLVIRHRKHKLLS